MTKQTIFITGTGTDVGKTFITAGIASICKSLKYSTAVMKPVQTGSDDFKPDLEEINTITPGLYPLPAELATPYTFKLPASPHLAAEEEDIEVNPEVIIKAYNKIQNYDLDFLLLEGAGGVYVPLTKKYLMIDLISQLKPKVIVTALAGLGTINHTLLTINALKSNNIEVIGTIINKFPSNPSLIEKDNIKIIEEISKTPIIAVIKEVKSTNNISDAVEKEFNSQIKLKEMIKSLIS